MGNYPNPKPYTDATIEWDRKHGNFLVKCGAAWIVLSADAVASAYLSTIPQAEPGTLEYLPATLYELSITVNININEGEPAEAAAVMIKRLSEIELLTTIVGR